MEKPPPVPLRRRRKRAAVFGGALVRILSFAGLPTLHHCLLVNREWRRAAESREAWESLAASWHCPDSAHPKQAVQLFLTKRRTRSLSNVACPPTRPLAVVLPRTSVAEELRNTTFLHYKQAGSTRSSAHELELLEQQVQVLLRRMRAAVPQHRNVLRQMESLSNSSLAAKRDAGFDILSDIQSEVVSADRRIVAATIRKARHLLVYEFERRVCQSVLTEAAIPFKGVESFGQLQMLLSNPQHFGTEAYLVWGGLQRSLPVSDIYFDLREILLDPAVSVSDECAAGRTEGAVHWNTVKQSTHDLVHRAHVLSGTPGVWMSILHKMFAVVHHGLRLSARQILCL